MRFVVLWLVPVTAAAWLLRSALVPLLRRRWPAAARFVDQWWAWAPLVVVLVALALVHPSAGLAGVLAVWLLLTSRHALGSPFRPRR